MTVDAKQVSVCVGQSDNKLEIEFKKEATLREGDKRIVHRRFEDGFFMPTFYVFVEREQRIEI